MAEGGGLKHEGEGDLLARLGVERTPDGGLVIPKQALDFMDAERARRVAISRVPSTPRFVQRDVGGVAVRKGQGKFESLSFESLRQIREKSPLLQTIHAARHGQIRRMCKRWNGKKGDVGWEVVHRDHYQQRETPEAIQPYIRRFERILEEPATMYDVMTTADLLVPLEEDFLTINRPVIEPLYSAFDPGVIVGFRPVDGALIWPTLEWVQLWIREHPTEWAPYQRHGLSPAENLEVLSTILGQELAGRRWCVVREGVVEATYRAQDLIVGPMATRTDVQYVGYQPSHVEQAIELALTFLNVYDFNAGYFTRGMMAEFILGVSGDVPPEFVDSFIDQLREATQGVGRAWQPPIIDLGGPDGTIEKIDLKPANKDMAFETFMSLLVAFGCGIYRMHPLTVNAKPWSGGSSPSLSEGSREKEIALAQEEGLHSDLDHLESHMVTPLAKRCHPDLRVIWHYGEDDEQRTAQVLDVRTDTDLTRNEARLAQGAPPKGFWVPDEDLDDLDDDQQKAYDDNPWNWPKDSTWAQIQQQRAMAAQMQPQGNDGFGGDPNKPDDGFGGDAPYFPQGGGPGAGAQPGQPPPGMQMPPGTAPPGAAGPGGQGGMPPGAAPMAKARPRLTIFVDDDHQ